MRQYQAENREQIAERKRRQYAANSELLRQCARRRRAADPEKARKAAQRRREANREQIAAAARKERAALKAQVLDHYGHTCACCGTTEQLTVDHVNGDGGQHRMELFGTQEAGSAAIHRWLIKNGFPDGFQVLCWPCNRSKGNGKRCRLDHHPDRGGTNEGFIAARKAYRRALRQAS